jgi:hypothetical protein
MKVTGVDRDAAAIAPLQRIAETIVADIEQSPWPLGERQFDLVLEVPDGAALAGFFAAPSGLSGAARLEWRDTAHFSLPRLQLASPALAASAALNLGVSGRPNLAGRIEITKLDLDALAPPAPAPTTPGGVAPSGTPAAGDGRIIPDIALPVAPLMGLDAEVNLALSGFSFRNLPRAGLQTDMRLKDGALALAPFNLTLPAGRLAGQATVKSPAPRLMRPQASFRFWFTSSPRLTAP